MELSFVTVDVFTRTRFRGNPLAVVTIPATGPPPTFEQKLAVAREFNLSETVFIHAATDDPASRRIDIFLTTAEIPFAGHPTIGAAVTLLPHGVTTLVAKAGPIAITKTADDAVSAGIPHNVHLHARRLQDVSLAHAALSADPVVRAAELAAPIFSIVNGMAFILVELPSLAALAAVQQSGAKFDKTQLLDEGWQSGFIGRYYFVRTAAPSTTDGTTTVALRTRMIEATMEDPATGSAACCLSSYLSTVGQPDGAPATSHTRYEITQGVEMGKESNITVEVAVKDSKVDTVSLAGAAVQVMRGSLVI